MKKYLLHLLVLTLVLVVVSLVPLWSGAAYYLPILTLMPLYFAVVTGSQHYLTLQSAQKDPRTFVKNFLSLTVGVLLLHLIVIVIWSFTHVAKARTFLLAFCIAFAAYLVFETIETLLFIRNQRNQNQ